MNFKRKIQIRDDVTEIISLPCVNYVGKLPDLGVGYHYHLFAGLMHDYREDLTHNHIAHKGDWLCEDYNGMWHIIKQ